MRSAVVTPFNVFSAFSFILLTGIAILVHNSGIPRIFLAGTGAVGGFLLIIIFLVWTLFEGD